MPDAVARMGTLWRRAITRGCVVYSARHDPGHPVNASPAAPAKPLLELHSVSKTLATRPVLRGVDLEVAAGELVVLLGPNGAGKTTLLGTACGRLAPDDGHVLLCGGNPRTDPHARARLGFVPQELALYPYLSVRENLEVFGRLMGVRGARLDEAVADALRWGDLEARSAARVDTLSGGMRRRLNIVASLLHQPEVLLLDEPTVGVDVNARERIHELLKRLRARGLGLLLTTHDLQQATTLADRVVFLLAGDVHLAGAPDALIRQVYDGGRELLVTFLAPPQADAGECLRERGLHSAHGGLTWSGTVTDDYADLGPWTETFKGLGLDVAELRVREPTLEGVFLRLTGTELKL